MKFLLTFLFAFYAEGHDLDWKPLENCVQRLKIFETSIGKASTFRQLLSLDRRLHHMLESIHYTEYNSERLREVASDEAADRLSPYLVSNATVSCEKFETRLTTYLSGLKRFLFFFFVTTLSVSLYGAYLFSLLKTKS